MRKIVPFVLLLPAIMLLVVSCGKESTSSSEPVLSVTPSSLGFGSTRSEDTLTVANTGGATLNWSATYTRSWLSLGSSQGALDAGASSQVVVTVDRSGLSGGDHSDAIEFTSDGGQANVNVSMHTSILQVVPSALDFGAAQDSLQITLTNTATDTTVQWNSSVVPQTYQGDITLAPSTGTLYGSPDSETINVVVDRSTLAEGVHEALIYLYAGQDSAVVEVSLEVSPVLSLSPFSLVLGAPDTAQILVGNSGFGTLYWALDYGTDDGGSWLEVEPLSGQNNHDSYDTVNAVVDSVSSSLATYFGWIAVSSDGGNDTVRVSSTVKGCIYYDDGTYEDGVRLNEPGYLLARFNNPGAGNVTLSRMMIDVMAEPAQVKICGWSSTQTPDYVPYNLLYEPPTLYTLEIGENIFSELNWDFDGTFFVGYYQPDTLAPYLSTDLTGTSALRSYFGDPSQWYYLTDANFAIRAYVTGGPTVSGAGRERELSPDAVYFLPSEQAEPSSIDKQKLIRLFER